MDKYIEIFTFLFKEENVLYSIGLLVLVFFISEFFIFLWSKKSSDAIKTQLQQEKNISETATQKNEELLISQKNNEKHIENLQEKLKQLSQSLMDVEKELTDIKLIEGKFEKLYLDQQSEFNEQKIQLAELSINQQKIKEIEEEAIQLAKELSFSKQQLKQQSSVTVDTADSIVDEDVVEKVSELETTIQKNNQQLVQFSEKLELLLTKPMIQDDSSFTDNDQENEGIVSKLISLVSFHDNKKTTTDDVQNRNDESIVQDIWQKHRVLINQLTDQLVVQTENDEQKVTAIENEIEATESNVMDDISDEIEETVEEIKEAVEENVDHFQQKLKGFYRKLVS